MDRTMCATSCKPQRPTAIIGARIHDAVGSKTTFAEKPGQNRVEHRLIERFCRIRKHARRVVVRVARDAAARAT